MWKHNKEVLIFVFFTVLGFKASHRYFFSTMVFCWASMFVGPGLYGVYSLTKGAAWALGSHGGMSAQGPDEAAGATATAAVTFVVSPVFLVFAWMSICMSVLKKKMKEI